MRKYLFSLCIILIWSVTYSQRDSVHSLFPGGYLHVPLRYSYLQWDIGYTGFEFSKTYINGYCFDLIGVVFNNDLDVALGLQGGGNAYGYAPIYTVASYSALYLKFEPMLFNKNLVNVSVPLDFSYSNFTISTGRHNIGPIQRFPAQRFPAFTPGADVFLNIFHFLSIGAGVNYRVAFSMPGSPPWNDYDNFSFSGMIRLKLYPHNRHTRLMDYYIPPQQHWVQ